MTPDQNPAPIQDFTPIRENARFPGFYAGLIGVVSFAIATLLDYLTYLAWRHFYPDAHTLIALLIVALIILVETPTLIYITYSLSIFTINHLVGHPFIETTPPKSNSVYATAYSITPTHTLPHAYNQRDHDGDPFCELYLCLSYAEIFDAYARLRKTHRIFCYLNTISLPSHLGRRTPILTRRTAQQILDAMRTQHPDLPNRCYAIICYPFYASYPDHIALPERQVFLSRDIIRNLLHALGAEGNALPRTETIVNIGDGESLALTARYLRESFTRISTENEFIYLPLS